MFALRSLSTSLSVSLRRRHSATTMGVLCGTSESLVGSGHHAGMGEITIDGGGNFEPTLRFPTFKIHGLSSVNMPLISFLK